MYKQIFDEKKVTVEQKVSVFLDRLFTDFLAKKNVLPMFYQYCNYIFLSCISSLTYPKPFKKGISTNTMQIYFIFLIIFIGSQEPRPQHNHRLNTVLLWKASTNRVSKSNDFFGLALIFFLILFLSFFYTFYVPL